MKNLKKMSVKFYLMLALSAVAVLVGCKDDEEVVTPQFPDLKEQTVTLTETTDENGNNVFSASLDITFSANLDWTLKSDAAWCRFVNGEIKETTASGKAGDQTLKVEISDASWNYTSADVAQITLSMASQEQVIYKITRGMREYQNLVVTNEAGDISYSSSTPLEIKGNNANVVTTSLRASAEAGMEIGLQYPEWLTMSINQETGAYDFTFNTESENDIRYPIENTGDVISFYTSDAETAETDKVRRIDIPVSYEGFDKRALVIQSAHNGLSVDADGTINTEEGQKQSVSSTITANSNDFVILKGLVEKYELPDISDGEGGMIDQSFAYRYDFEQELNWVEVTQPTTDGVVTLSVKANDSEEEREAIVVLLPKALVDEYGTNYNDYLLIREGDVDSEGNPLTAGDLKSEFSTFVMASLTQAKKNVAQEEISFISRAIDGGGTLMSYSDVGLSNIESVKIESSELESIKSEYADLADVSNVWKIVIPKDIYEMGLVSGMPIIIEAVGRGDGQTMSNLSTDSGITCSEDKRQGSLWIQSEMSNVDIYGLSISGTLTDHYDIVVKNSDGTIASFCRLELGN
ncbi:Bacteroidetes-Associated Carbohydrate-binding Often N-terminal [uncultured Bacteroides sp.]|uniref:BACON domain-containing protein n=2 Tax=Bacteroides TaxID=816 RepID=UPI0008204677|nr:BACON domain-containing protein [Bacteroides sp. ET336]SCI54102.1 Bacteroidetes-Associated Carbohydrate-binding Often N-terminal [uncultured Bacteroides sp.]